MFVCGIDPGFSGALAFISIDKHITYVFDMPCNKETFFKNNKLKSRATLNTKELISLLRQFNILHLYLEQVSSRPGEGVTGAFRFGNSFGQLEGIIIAENITFSKIHPASWKKEYNLLNKEKEDSLLVARKLFPLTDLKLQKHHGRADALLIAELCRNNHLARQHKCMHHTTTITTKRKKKCKKRSKT